MVHTLYITVSIALGYALTAAHNAHAAGDTAKVQPRYITLAPSDVCAGTEYINPVDMIAYQGQKKCPTIEDLSCADGEAGQCVVTGKQRAVLQSAIDHSKVREGRSIGGVNGSYSDAKVNPPCEGDQQTGCRTNSAYPALKKVALSAKLKAGEVFHGISGTYSNPIHDCSAGKTDGCNVAAGFVAVLKADLQPHNIKNGETIAGVEGIFPSDSAKLDTANPGLADLEGAKFGEQIAASASFNFYDHNGNQHTIAGDDQLKPDRIRTGVTVFSTAGTAILAPNFDNVRKSIGLYGNRGRLKLDCRNAFAPSYQGDTTYPSVDDGGNGEKLTNFPSHPLWTTANLCGEELWHNATVDDAGNPVTCNSQSEPCVYRHLVTGLQWLNDSTKVKKSKDDAKTQCAEVEIAGKKGWRLPTHRELLQAYVHRLRYVSTSTNFLDPNVYYWTSSSRPDSDPQYSFKNVAIKPANGETFVSDDSSHTFNILCVK